MLLKSDEMRARGDVGRGAVMMTDLGAHGFSP